MKNDFIFIAGAPGSGKTTITRLLQEKLHTFSIDFGWLREFHLDREWKHASKEEENMCFENLVFILKNYTKNEYKDVIVNDLLDFRIQQIPDIFRDYKYIILSLVLTDDEVLKTRVLNQSRDSGYRDFEKALEWNRDMQKRPLLLNEKRIDNTSNSPEQTVEQILGLLS